MAVARRKTILPTNLKYMSEILQAYIALMMIIAGNSPVVATSTVGDYYEVRNVQYVASENKTYSIWVRDRVENEYTKAYYHLHVEVSEGKRTLSSLVAEAQTRLDEGITALPK